MATVIKSIHAEWADDARSGAYWLVTADVIVDGRSRTIQAKAWSLHDVVPAIHETIRRYRDVRDVPPVMVITDH